MADETEQEEHEENVEEDLGDSRCGNGDTGESQHRGNERNHEKRDSHTQHSSSSLADQIQNAIRDYDPPHGCDRGAMRLASLFEAGDTHHPLVAVVAAVFVCSVLHGAEGSGTFHSIPEEMLYVFPVVAAF